MSERRISMPRIAFAAAALAVAAQAAQPARALEFPAVPAHDAGHVDAAGMLDAETAAEIDRIGAALWQESRTPLVVVTIPSLADMGAVDLPIERYAAALREHWQLGGERSGHAALLVVSRDDRRACIEIGPAWGVSVAALRGEILEDLVVPELRDGRFAAGLLQGARGLDALLRGLDLPRPRRPWWMLPLLGATFIALLLLVVSLSRSGREGWGWWLLAGLGACALALLPRSGGRERPGTGGEAGGEAGARGASGSW